MEQMQKLENMAEKFYGDDPAWEYNGAQFLKRQKLIQIEALARMKAAAKAPLRTSADTVRAAGAKAVKREVFKPPKPRGWRTIEPVKGKRFKSFASAKALLGLGAHGEWINDRDAPGSGDWRRYISINRETNEYIRARICKGPAAPCFPAPCPNELSHLMRLH